LAGTSYQICGTAGSKDPTKVSRSPEYHALLSLTFCRGNKRPVEANDTVETSHPKKRINKNSCDLWPAFIIDSNDDMGTLSEKNEPKRCLIDIQISKHLRSPDARLNGPEATRQAVFEDLNWVPKILVTEAKKQAQWRKMAESDRADADAERDKQEAVKKEKKARELELNRERQRQFRAAHPKPTKKPHRTIDQVRI
jgi:hypothetical protein